MEDRQTSGIGGTLGRLLEGKWTGWIINLVVIPGLLVASLLLPPVSIRENLFEADFSRIDAGGGSVTDPDGTQVTVFSDGVVSPIRVNSATRAPRGKRQKHAQRNKARGSHQISKVLVEGPNYPLQWCSRAVRKSRRRNWSSRCC